MGIQHSRYIQDRGILRGSYRSILRMEIRWIGRRRTKITLLSTSKASPRF